MRSKANNRATAARSRAKRQERVLSVMNEVIDYMVRTPIMDDFGKVKGYAITFEFPDDAYDRFEALALEHGKSSRQLMDECVAVYFEESRRMQDERN